jgi:hypothetical protein
MLACNGIPSNALRHPTLVQLRSFLPSSCHGGGCYKQLSDIASNPSYLIPSRIGIPPGIADTTSSHMSIKNNVSVDDRMDDATFDCDSMMRLECQFTKETGFQFSLLNFNFVLIHPWRQQAIQRVCARRITATKRTGILLQMGFPQHPPPLAFVSLTGFCWLSKLFPRSDGGGGRRQLGATL